MHLPQWAGLALLVLALVVTVPGRHGQRALNAALLGGGAAALCFFGLRGVLHDWVPGIAAIVAGVLVSLFGLVAVGWATASLVALIFAVAGSFAAHFLHLWIAPVAVFFAGLGLFAGMVNHRRLSVVLPPLFAAAFVALGCAICWAPHWRGAKLWQLNDVDWVLGLFAAAAAALLAVALEREHRKKLRLLSRTKRMEDEELKKKLAAQQAAYQRYQRLNAPDDKA
jgi:hypothetical protein